MIPKQVTEIAEALEPGYADQHEIFEAKVIAAAWRVYWAGFRRVEDSRAERAVKS